MRALGMDRESIAAVESYGKRNIAFVGRVLDPKVMAALSDRVHSMRATMTHAQVVEVLNAEHVQNEIVPGAAWTVMHTQKLTRWRRSQARRKSNRNGKSHRLLRQSPAGVRCDLQMWPRRDHARERLAMRDAAFERAAELHAQIAELQAQLSQAQHVVELGNEAEQMLISTGPPQLHEHLNKLKANTSTAANRDELTSHQKKSKSQPSFVCKKIGANLPADVNAWIEHFSWHAAELCFEARTPALPTNSEPGSAARVCAVSREA